MTQARGRDSRPRRGLPRRIGGRAAVPRGRVGAGCLSRRLCCLGRRLCYLRRVPLALGRGKEQPLAAVLSENPCDRPPRDCQESEEGNQCNCSLARRLSRPEEIEA